MNTSTDKTQNSISLSDKAEAIGIILEQAEYTLDLLSGDYQTTGNYPIFMVISDLIVKARQQNNELIGALPEEHVPPVTAKRYPLPESVSDLVENNIRDAAFELVAITKAIFGWAVKQKALPMGGGILDMDSGDIVSLSDMAIRRAQRIVDLSNEFESKVTSVGVQA